MKIFFGICLLVVVFCEINHGVDSTNIIPIIVMLIAVIVLAALEIH